MGEDERDALSTRIILKYCPVLIQRVGDDTGVLLQGARLPNLPPSAATLLTQPKSKGNVVVIPRRTVLEESVLTDFAVEGKAEVEIEVVAP